MAPQMRPRLPSQLPISPAPRHPFTPKPPSISSKSDSSSQSGNPESVLFSALCMFDFTSSEAGLLSFRKNEILNIVKCADGWWAAMKKGDSDAILGWIPQTFVTPLTQEMAEKLQDIREELRCAELKRVEELHHSTESTSTSLSVNSDGSASLPPILESKDLVKLYDRRKSQKQVHPPPSPSHSRISPTSSTHHRPLARSATTYFNFSSPKGTDDTRLRGGSLSIRGPQRHHVVVDDDVTVSRISTLIRSTDFKQIDKVATSYPDTPFRTMSNAVFKPAQEDKLPRKLTESGGIPFVTISGINKEVEKHKVQGEVIEPGGRVIDISRPPSDSTPWYLRPRYADQLDTDDKGNVRFGSLLSLFEMLTFPPKPTKLAQYKTFTNVFLMTFRTFTSADHLFDMLVERFHLKPNESLTEPEYLNWKANLRIPVQRVVLDIFNRWLENYQLFEEEPHIAQRLEEFLNLIVSLPHNKMATIIIQTIDRMRSIEPIRVVSSTPKARMSKFSKLDLLKLHHKALAGQLTVYEFGLYAKITPQQCLTYVKSRTGDDVAKLRDFCSTHDKLDAWVKLSILNGDTAAKRAQTVDFWIKVAERCRGLNNISSMSAIITALSSTVITGLQLTWARTCRKSVLDGLLRYNDPTGGFAKYRVLLQQVEGPCVPFITMFLTEMVHVDQLSGTEGRISFYQRTRWYEAITAMLMFQTRPYKIATDELTISFIEGHLREGSCCDPGWFWKRSQEIQRAEATHADIRRGLEAAGF